MSNLRPSPIFIADAKGIDFLNSIATPVDTPVEWLGSGGDLLAWLKESNVAPLEVINRFRQTALPGELDAVSQTIAAMMDGRFVALNITKRALDLFFHWFSHPDARVP